MTKEKKTARELQEMIFAAMGDRDYLLNVSPIKQIGWQAGVVAHPSRVVDLQTRVNAIADKLRAKYDLAA